MSNQIMVKMAADISQIQSAMEQMRSSVNGAARNTEQQTSGISRAWKGALKIAGGAIAAFTAKNFINESVQAAESARILNRTLTNTFRDNYDQARKRMNALANTFGMVNGVIDKEFATFSRSWLQAGKTMDQAMGLTERQMKTAMNASVGLGYSFDYTSERLKAFMMGNLMAAPRVFGDVTDAATINAWAIAQGSRPMDQLTAQQQKIMRLRFAEYMQKKGNMAGYYADGAQDLTVIQGNLSNEMERFRAIVGEPFLEIKRKILLRVVDAAVKFNNFIEEAGGVTEAFRKATERWRGPIIEVTAALSILTAGILTFKIKTMLANGTLLTFVKSLKLVKAAIAIKTGALKAAKIAFMIIKSPILVVTGLLAAVIPVIMNLWRTNEQFRNGVIGVFNAVRDTITNVISVVTGAFRNWDGSIRGLGNVFTTIFNGIRTTITNIIPTIREAGANIMNGLIGGINRRISAVMDTARNVARRVTDTIQGALRIGSPSRVMADEVGRWIPEGVAVGVEANARNLDRTMKELVEPPKVDSRNWDLFQGTNQREQQTSQNNYNYNGLFEGATIIWNNKEDIRQTMQEMAWITQQQEVRLV